MADLFGYKESLLGLYRKLRASNRKVQNLNCNSGTDFLCSRDFDWSRGILQGRCDVYFVYEAAKVELFRLNNLLAWT